MLRDLEPLIWPVAAILIAAIIGSSLVLAVRSSNEAWTNNVTACVQNGGQVIGGQCLR